MNGQEGLFWGDDGIILTDENVMFAELCKLTKNHGFVHLKLFCGM